MKTAKAFAPAGISSFFEICDKIKGKPILDLERVGSRGGGFGIQKGVWTQVNVKEAKKIDIKVFINNSMAPEAETTRTVAEMLLSKMEKPYDVVVHHTVEVPIGAGFGTSAGGALTTGLALKEALNLPLTYNQIGRIAHVAEIQCKTGLGTVGPLMLGGCALTLEPGAPGISVIDRLPISPDCVVVAGFFGPIPTKQVLSSPEKRRRINQWGNKTLQEIMNKPTLENFLDYSLKFAEKTGFMTPQIRELARLAEKAGAIGSAQNMLGEAVHSLVSQENADKVAEVFKQVKSIKQVIVSKIDSQGARLIS